MKFSIIGARCIKQKVVENKYIMKLREFTDVELKRIVTYK